VAVVTATVRNEQRPFVGDAHETRRIAARRAAEAVGAGRGEREKRRRLDECTVMHGDAVALLRDRRPERLPIEALERFDAGDDVIAGKRFGHSTQSRCEGVLAYSRSCREQLPPIMAGDGEIEDHARRGGACEPNRRELLGMATLARDREHPPGRTDLRREMAIESSPAFLTQPGCALLYRCARDLRHARRWRAGPRREWKDVEMRQRAG